MQIIYGHVWKVNLRKRIIKELAKLIKARLTISYWQQGIGNRKRAGKQAPFRAYKESELRFDCRR